VTVHSAPLREQGTWAEQHIAAAEDVAVLPPGAPFEAVAALPVPALTADQVIGDALQVRAGQTVLVHGAGGVTGSMLVQLAAHRGATVIATAGRGQRGPGGCDGGQHRPGLSPAGLARTGARADRWRRRRGSQRGTRRLGPGRAGSA
jgi:hypothetical protein